MAHEKDSVWDVGKHTEFGIRCHSHLSSIQPWVICLTSMRPVPSSAKWRICKIIVLLEGYIVHWKWLVVVMGESWLSRVLSHLVSSREQTWLPIPGRRRGLTSLPFSSSLLSLVLMVGGFRRSIQHFLHLQNHLQHAYFLASRKP